MGSLRVKREDFLRPQSFSPPIQFLTTRIGGVDLIRFGGHLPKGGYDVQTDGRHPPAPAAPAIR